MEKIILRPTRIMQAMVCPKKLAFLNAGIEPQSEGINLIFGRSIHRAIEGYLLGFYTAADMVSLFKADMIESVKGKLVLYPKSKDLNTYLAIGERLCSSFESYWKCQPLKAVYAELPLKIDLGNEVELHMTIDLVATLTRDIITACGKKVEEGSTAVIDWKTQASSETMGFAGVSYQFAYYGMGLTAHAETLGIPAPNAYGYAVGIKPNIQSANSASLFRAAWEPIAFTSRSERIQREAFKVAHGVADKIRNNQLFRQPGMAFNTPCDSPMSTCDFVNACLYGEFSNLHIPHEVDIVKIAA